MAQFDCKEDYLAQLKGQIRCKKAKSLVAEEIDQHIEDQKASYMKEGDDENIAMGKALEQMGDPLEAGKQLDKIHKPKTEWHILLVVLALCCFGALAQISIEYAIYKAKIPYSIDIGRHILFLAVGFLLMITVYFFNYSIIGKYPKIIWFLLLVVLSLYAPLGTRINGQLQYLYAYGILFIPVYGGIIYAYRKEGYSGIIKCLLFSITTIIIEQQCVAQSSVYLGFLLACIIMLSAAAMRNWFGTSKKISMAIIWGWIPIAIIALLFSSDLRLYRIERLSSFLHPYENGYQISIVSQVLSHAKLFGGTTDFMIGYLPGLNSNYILTYVIGKWGFVAGVLCIGLFITLIGRIIYISYHQKNSLGMFVGLGCCLVFAVQGCIYILTNLGFQLIAQVNLPFVSYGGSSLFVNFIVMGIILSVFRNTNIQKEVPYKKLLSINLSINLEKVN